MTPPTLPPPRGQGSRDVRLLTLEPLTPAAFSDFGTAISTPFGGELNTPPASIPQPVHHPHQPVAVFANQNSALKTVPLSQFVDNYPAGSKAQMSMFSCFPRNLSGIGVERVRGKLTFKVAILERHPYTTQTFSPLGLGNAEPTAYLVIVAPSLPTTSVTAGDGSSTRIANPPDLARLRAFYARGDQAVTYGPGTWHAPMVVLGRRRVDFVVTQFVNGVPEDDCQEVLLGDNAVGVGMEILESLSHRGTAKL